LYISQEKAFILLNINRFDIFFLYEWGDIRGDNLFGNKFISIVKANKPHITRYEFCVILLYRI